MRSNSKDFSFVLAGAKAGESIFLGIRICSTRWQHAEYVLSILLLHPVINTAQEIFLCLPSLLAKSKLQDYAHFLPP